MLVFRKIIYAFFFLSGMVLYSQNLQFKENKGQWPVSVLFGTESGPMKTWITKTGFRNCLYNMEELSAAIASVKERKHSSTKVHGHIYEVEFVNADLSHFTKEEKCAEYYNYFLGSDSSHWASRVSAWNKISFSGIYPGVSLFCYSQNNCFKYDLRLLPESSLSSVQIQFNDAETISIENGDLVIHTSAGEVREKKPIAWQIINGKKKIVPCSYVLNEKNRVSFSAEYDKTKELIIDPVVLASSYSGTSTFAYGSTATYDSNGNIYTGVWADPGYPTTTGAFYTNGGAFTDCVITAYNSNASAVLFSTYLGGDSLDFPASIKVSNNEIILAGQTESPNFPTTAGAFDNSLSGKTDLYISKLNMSGTTLNASTLVGGSGDESLPQLALTTFGWMTGSEMWADNSGQVYFASCSTSPNFPTTPGAQASSLNGASDAVYFCMNTNLSALSWSTYIGGSLKDDGSGIRPDGHGGAYCIGSTKSTNFPVTSGAYQTSFNTGQGADMFICHLSNLGTVLNATYFGTSGNDLGYFLDVDQNNSVYFCGHIDISSLFTPTPGTFNNSMGENVIARLDSSLGSVVFQTKFGSTSYTTYPKVYFTTLKVDTCGNIYTSGTGYKYLPVTPNALMNYQGGSTDIWMGVFNPNCASLRYGTYYGGNGGAPTGFTQVGDQNWGTCHVDDKGVLYLTLAATTGFPTLPSAYDTSYSNSTTTPTIYNDIAVKFDFETFLTAGTSYGPTLTGCVPYTGTFISAWGNGNVYWDFFDGITSTQDSVTHYYPALGSYDVLLVVTDTSTCNKIDSVMSQVQIINQTQFDLGPDVYLCGDTVLTINSNVTAMSYSWNTGSHYPNIHVNTAGLYSLTINNGGCDTKDSLMVIEVSPLIPEKFPNVVTPNSDSVNDFIDLSKYDFTDMKFSLFNRWGKIVFETEDATARWKPDTDLPEGTYYYVLEYSSRCSGENRKEKGFISVFR